MGPNAENVTFMGVALGLCSSSGPSREGNHQSVEGALQIEPATAVTYSWQGNTLYVQPVAGQLAPNTQYKLTLTTTAKTEGGVAIHQPAPITFVTGAKEHTPPSASPSPVVTGVALANPAGLAVDGAQGVQHVLELLRAELERAMLLAGAPSLARIPSALASSKESRP